jgi:hypothetical protein
MCGVGRTACFNEADSYDSSCVATGRVTYDGEVLAEEPDEVCPTIYGWRGYLGAFQSWRNQPS